MFAMIKHTSTSISCKLARTIIYITFPLYEVLQKIVLKEMKPWIIDILIWSQIWLSLSHIFLKTSNIEAIKESVYHFAEFAVSIASWGPKFSNTADIVELSACGAKFTLITE